MGKKLLVLLIIVIFTVTAGTVYYLLNNKPTEQADNNKNSESEEPDNRSIPNFKGGKLSRDNSMVAYIEINQTNNLATLYIYSILKGNDIAYLPLEHPYKYILNWSPNGKYLIVTDRVQEPYKQTHQIYEFQNNNISKIYNLITYGVEMLWKDNKLFYFSTKDNCNENTCYPNELWVEQLNLNDLQIKELKSLGLFEKYSPFDIHIIEINNTLNISMQNLVDGTNEETKKSTFIIEEL